MPIYEFECSSCSKVSEHIMKMSDKNPSSCPYCESKESLRKLMSQTSFVLKGEGWYETDFKGTPKKNSTESSAKSSPKEKKATSNSSNSSSDTSKTAETKASKSTT